MDERKPVQEYTDLELLEVIRSIVKGLKQKQLKELFPQVTPNDLSRLGRSTKKLSAQKRADWEEIVRTWEEAGRPDPLTVSEKLGCRHPSRIEMLFHFISHPAWLETGLPLKERLEVGERIVETDEFTPEERWMYRTLQRALLRLESHVDR